MAGNPAAMPNERLNTFPLSHRYVRIGLGVLGFLLLTAIFRAHRSPESAPPPPLPPSLETTDAATNPAQEWQVTMELPPTRRGLAYTFPTPQTRLQDLEDDSVYMPTASGRVISAHYGSTRTNSSGRAVFHEGVDIGPMRRDRRQHALDPIYAVADGTVAYTNRIAGNSTYGIYVVLTHNDEFGEFYTLYAHMGSIAEGLRAGNVILKGEPLGIMGHTSSFQIPPQRAHLHFEIGVINNQHFADWYRGKQRTPNHSTWHGHNLTGIDPMLLLLQLDPEADTYFSMRDAIRELPTAYTLAIQAPGQLDYFRRHPMLWQGIPFQSGVMLVGFCQAGTPLFGRAATPEEAEGVTARSPRVVEVFPDALGRNGRRKIARANNRWTLTPWGSEWLEILLYRAGRP